MPEAFSSKSGKDRLKKLRAEARARDRRRITEKRRSDITAADFF